MTERDFVGRCCRIDACGIRRAVICLGQVLVETGIFEIVSELTPGMAVLKITADHSAQREFLLLKILVAEVMIYGWDFTQWNETA